MPRHLTASTSSKYDWALQYAIEAFAEPPAADRASISYTGAMTTALTSPAEFKPKGVGGGVAVSGWNGQDDPVFRINSGSYRTGNGGQSDLALYGETKPGGSAQAATWYPFLTFVTAATNSVVEFAFYGGTLPGSVMFEVDGRWLQQSRLRRTNTASGYTLTLTFPTARSRTITIKCSGDTGISAVRVPTGETITKPTAPIRRRIAVIGDSWANGSGEVITNDGALGVETFAARLMKLMGADDQILAGIGGTGWTAGGAGSTYQDRLSAVMAMSPHVIVFYGSINDPQDGTGVAAAVTTALTTVASVPEVYVVGPALNGWAAQNAVIKPAVLAKNRQFIDMSNFFYGSGKTDNPKGDGNRDFFLLPDGSHPTFGGHKVMAEYIFREIYSKNQ